MLYDNALLVPAYLEAYLVDRATREFARVARETCDWALREMLTPEGGFASAQDADSEGEEGRFFVWSPDELDEVLGRARPDAGGRVLRRHARGQLRERHERAVAAAAGGRGRAASSASSEDELAQRDGGARERSCSPRASSARAR